MLLGKVGNAVIGKVVTEKVIAAVLTRVGARVAAKSALSFVPFVGSTVAAAISFAMMNSVGNGHVADCYRIVERMLDGTNEAKATEAAVA